MGNYDNKGVSSAYLKLKAELRSVDSGSDYYRSMNVRVTNNSGKPVTFYDSALLVRDSGYYLDVQTMYEYNENTKNRKAAQEIDINSGKSKTIQYELSSSDQDIYNSDDYIELQALFEYDGRYYILAVGEDFAGFVGYDQ